MSQFIRPIVALTLAGGILLAASCGKGQTNAPAVTPTDTSDAVSSEAAQKHRFSPEDCTVHGVTPGMTLEEVKDILGKPDYEYIVDADELQPAYKGLEYPGITLSFDKDSDRKYRLSCIYIREENIPLANGLHVGSTLYEAVDAFDNPQHITFKEDSQFFDDVFYVYDSSGLIPGVFDSDWPDEPVQTAYCFDYRKEMAPLMYIYCEPPVWNQDRTGFTMTSYTLYFKNTPGDVRITQIDIVKRTEILTKGD